ncbi:MAG: DNA polymerase III subunit beta [Candidatus Buchananbacteria bacterium]
MKISCTQENLSQGLNAVGHIASKNLNLPILSNILFKVENKNLTLMATNLEIGITTNIRGKIEGDGDFTVDAKLLANYISFLPKERIDLETDGDNIKVECQNQKTKIKTQLAADFPLIPKLNKDNPCTVEAKLLKQAILEVVFACSASESRPELSGVLMEFAGNNIILAATDSYRLAESRVSLIENKVGERKIIIPSKTMQEVSRVLSSFKDEESIDGVDTIEIYIGESQIMFSYNNIDIVSRLIEGQYPDYKQIIPANFTGKTKINIAELSKNIKASSLFAKNGIYDIKLDFSVPEYLTVTSSSVQAGENVSQVKAEISGEKTNIILNYKYLLDGLQTMNSEDVEIEIIDSNNPFLIRPANRDDYFYIIMPIRQ